MAQLIIVDGKPITIFDDNDFEQLLRDKIGNDAADYFAGHKARLLDELINAPSCEVSELCGGECAFVKELCDEHEDEIDGIQSAVRDLRMIIKSAQIDEDSKNDCLEIIDTILY